MFLTLPISEVHDTTMVLGTVVDSLTREVMLMGLLGLFGSTPFLVGGRYPCSKHKINTSITKLHMTDTRGGTLDQVHAQWWWTVQHSLAGCRAFRSPSHTGWEGNGPPGDSSFLINKIWERMTQHLVIKCFSVCDDM